MPCLLPVGEFFIRSRLTSPEVDPTSRFCPTLRFLMIIPSCLECNNLRSDLDKNEDMAFIGQSGGTIERI